MVSLWSIFRGKNFIDLHETQNNYRVAMHVSSLTTKPTQQFYNKWENVIYLANFSLLTLSPKSIPSSTWEIFKSSSSEIKWNKYLLNFSFDEKKYWILWKILCKKYKNGTDNKSNRYEIKDWLDNRNVVWVDLMIYVD